MLHQTPGLGFGFDEAAVTRYGGACAVDDGVDEPVT